MLFKIGKLADAYAENNPSLEALSQRSPNVRALSIVEVDDPDAAHVVLKNVEVSVVSKI